MAYAYPNKPLNAAYTDDERDGKIRPLDLSFHGSKKFTLGVELELQILDRETGDLSPGAIPILKACAEEGVDGVSAELMQSMFEVKTDICANVAEVEEQLLSRLRRVRNISSSLGYQLAIGGTHPFHRTSASAVFPDDRYDRTFARLAWITYQRVVFGLHVHVGIANGDLAIAVMNHLVQYLPHLLALSANSPFWQGTDTGLASARAALYRLLPHSGVPRNFHTWKEFRNFCKVMRDCGIISSFKDFYWDIRPRPDLGTLEFRICDMPPSLPMVYALTALIRALVISSVQLMQEKPSLKKGAMKRYWIAIENKWLATRYGLNAIYLRTPGGRRRPLRKELEALFGRLMPVMRECGDARYIAPIQNVEKIEIGADRQRRLYREVGQWKLLIDDMARRLEEDLCRPIAYDTARQPALQQG